MTESERSFWNRRIEWKKEEDASDGKSVTAEGYILARTTKGDQLLIGDENIPYRLKGSGAARYLFRMTDGVHKGKVIFSTNVWNNGKIPESLRDALTPNCIVDFKAEPTHFRSGTGLVPWPEGTEEEEPEVEEHSCDQCGEALTGEIEAWRGYLLCGHDCTKLKYMDMQKEIGRVDWEQEVEVVHVDDLQDSQEEEE